MALPCKFQSLSLLVKLDEKLTTLSAEISWSHTLGVPMNESISPLQVRRLAYIPQLPPLLVEVEKMVSPTMRPRNGAPRARQREVGVEKVVPRGKLDL